MFVTRTIMYVSRTKGGKKMNKVYLNTEGKVFVNDVEVEHVYSVSTKTGYLGSSVILEFDADYKSDYRNEVKVHPLDERPKKDD